MVEGLIEVGGQGSAAVMVGELHPSGRLADRRLYGRGSRCPASGRYPRTRRDLHKDAQGAAGRGQVHSGASCSSSVICRWLLRRAVTVAPGQNLATCDVLKPTARAGAEPGGGRHLRMRLAAS